MKNLQYLSSRTFIQGRTLLCNLKGPFYLRGSSFLQRVNINVIQGPRVFVFFEGGRCLMPTKDLPPFFWHANAKDFFFNNWKQKESAIYVTLTNCTQKFGVFIFWNDFPMKSERISSEAEAENFEFLKPYVTKRVINNIKPSIKHFFLELCSNIVHSAQCILFPHVVALILKNCLFDLVTRFGKQFVKLFPLKLFVLFGISSFILLSISFNISTPNRNIMRNFLKY